MLPFSAAAINAVEPSSCSAFGSAPFFNNSATTGPLPEPAARDNGVKPAREKTFKLAFALIRRSATSTPSGDRAASISAVMPSASFASTSAPKPINVSITSWCAAENIHRRVQTLRCMVSVQEDVTVAN